MEKGKSKKVFYVNCSDLGSIADANPWYPRCFALLKYWCRTNKEEARRFLKENGYVVTDDEAEVAEEVGKVEKEFEAIIGKKRPKTSEDVKVIMETYVKKMKVAATKDKLSDEAVETLKQNMTSTLNKACGTNNEREILDKSEIKSGIKIRARNERLFYKVVHEDDDYVFKIGGKVDGISDDMIIEAKNRMSQRSVRKNVYDLYQVMGYMFLTDTSRGKIIQKHKDLVWDSNVETDTEWGIVTLDKRWENYYENELLPFFEELKQIPEDITFLSKPFLTVKKDRYLLSADGKKIEQEIFDLLYRKNVYEISDEDLMKALTFSEKETSEENKNVKKCENSEKIELLEEIINQERMKTPDDGEKLIKSDRDSKETKVKIENSDEAKSKP